MILFVKLSNKKYKLSHYFPIYNNFLQKVNETRTIKKR